MQKSKIVTAFFLGASLAMVAIAAAQGGPPFSEPVAHPSAMTDGDKPTLAGLAGQSFYKALPAGGKGYVRRGLAVSAPGHSRRER